MMNWNKQKNGKEYWAINFDLDTKEMEKSLGNTTKGYRLLEKSFKEVGFIHRQGSGYISLNKLNQSDIENITKFLSYKHEWLCDSIKTFDATIINEEKFSLENEIKAFKKEKQIEIEENNTALTFEDYLKQVKNKSKNNEFSR